MLTKVSEALLIGKIPTIHWTDGTGDPDEIQGDHYVLWGGTRKIAPCVVPIPNGFRTDGLSIPWGFQWAVPKEGRAWVASLPHDVSCAAELFGPADSNTLMKDVMAATGVGWWMRNAIYSGISAGCWITYRAHKAKEVDRQKKLVLQASRRLWRENSARFKGYAPIELTANLGVY